MGPKEPRRDSNAVKDLDEKGYHISNRDLDTMRRLYNADIDRYIMRRVKGRRGHRKFYIALKGYEKLAEAEIYEEY